MGGDLNLKKSWHPVLMSNQRRVWEEEKKALEERKRTEQRIKELKEERAKEEIQQKLEAAGSRKRVDRVDWMYQGPSNGQAGTTEEMEGYLLGKRRIDNLIKGTENKKLEKRASEDSFMALQNANTARDTASKVREDPMLAIKKREQEAYEAMMNDPIRRRALLAAMGAGEEKSSKSKEKRRHRHHHRHRRERDDSDDERSHKRRRTEDGSRERHSSRHHRRRSDSVSRSRSPEFDRDERGRRRSPSPRSSRRERDYHRDAPRDRSRDRRRRSPSYDSVSPSPPPDRRRRSYEDDQHYSNGRRKDYDTQEYRRSNGSSENVQRPTGKNGNYGRGDQRQASKKSDEDEQAERERKLAAMQQDASALDDAREKRLNQIAEQEKADREADERSRARSSKYGDKGDFMNGVHRKAGDMALGDRIGRGRQGLRIDE